MTAAVERCKPRVVGSRQGSPISCPPPNMRVPIRIVSSVLAAVNQACRPTARTKQVAVDCGRFRWAAIALSDGSVEPRTNVRPQESSHVEDRARLGRIPLVSLVTQSVRSTLSSLMRTASVLNHQSIVVRRYFRVHGFRFTSNGPNLGWRRAPLIVGTDRASRPILVRLVPEALCQPVSAIGSGTFRRR